MSERKAIILRSQHSEIDGLCNEISDLEEILDQKRTFTEKQCRNIIEASKKEDRKITKHQIKPLWVKLEGFLLAEGLIPKGFNLKEDTVGFDASGAVYIEKKHVCNEKCEEHSGSATFEISGDKMPKELKQLLMKLTRD